MSTQAVSACAPLTDATKPDIGLNMTGDAVRLLAEATGFLTCESAADPVRVSDRAMTHASPRTSRYVVSARAREGLLQQTRVLVASAVVLAQSWQDAGHTDVEVTDPSGNRLSLEKYRRDATCGRSRLR